MELVVVLRVLVLFGLPNKVFIIKYIHYQFRVRRRRRLVNVSKEETLIILRAYHATFPTGPKFWRT